MTVLAGVVEDRLGSRIAAQLGHGHAVQHGVHPAVAATVEPVPHRLSVTLGRRRREWRGPVEASEAALAGEATGVAHLDQQLSRRALGDAAPTARPPNL